MGLNVTFTNTSTGDIAAFLWDFGDGTYDDVNYDTSHTYLAGGTYNVTLYIWGIYGEQSQDTQPVTVSSVLPSPCSVVFDFTTGMHGWTILNNQAVYSPGVGFTSVDAQNWIDLLGTSTGFRKRGVAIEYTPFNAVHISSLIVHTISAHALGAGTQPVNAYLYGHIPQSGGSGFNWSAGNIVPTRTVTPGVPVDYNGGAMAAGNSTRIALNMIASSYNTNTFTHEMTVTGVEILC